jgi:hypothetical protein
MRTLMLLGILLCLAFLAATCWADTLTSCLGHQGPAFAPGTTPSPLGWGPDDKPYPDKFVVNPGDGSEMVWVPAGEFLMGSAAGEGDPNEHPPAQGPHYQGLLARQVHGDKRTVPGVLPGDGAGLPRAEQERPEPPGGLCELRRREGVLRPLRSGVADGGAVGVRGSRVGWA